MTGAPLRRVKSLSILAVVAWSALVFLSWSQPWFTLTAQGRAGDTLTVTVQGAAAAPALSALALAGLALSAALAIAGPVIRIILGLLELVLGLSILASSAAALADPVLAGQSAVTSATGVAGSSSILAIAQSTGSTPWPWVAAVAGALMAVTGILIVVTFRRWPVSGRKYQPVQFADETGRTSASPATLVEANLGSVGPETENSAAAPVGHETAGDSAPSTTASAETGVPVDLDAKAESDRTRAVDSWDSLSRGVDPTN
ncbi:Trp biosynthesis-associated membrane protein [Subtercola sp. PAMC28395]|uniref:Trp biosynthesis-associated membrane protein n=1 Tax=Subtercola sp. PAMC28395 TaxID=2846775 RepID=UPI001C0C8FE3|nr:Trp biosynthesis-associated membrane protein [Subtercola sp. PAMC28395]QWT23326.1 Trp biosynthesis-associated membrane protein [Subtercola sp. PAMC28395]